MTLLLLFNQTTEGGDIEGLKVGSTTVATLKVGSADVDAVYVGTVQVFP